MLIGTSTFLSNVFIHRDTHMVTGGYKSNRKPLELNRDWSLILQGTNLFILGHTLKREMKC